MKITYLCLGTSLALIPVAALGQCVATQDCATLGYTENSCSGGNGVKCPFGNKWFCGRSDEQCMELACDKLGFKYDCVGTGYEGGEGEACNGKYVACECSDGYEYTEGFCTIPCDAYITRSVFNCRHIDKEVNGIMMTVKCCSHNISKLTSEKFVNGKWQCEYSSTTTIMTNCQQHISDKFVKGSL